MGIDSIEVENREAKIGKSAPNFRCTAVDDEEFVEIELKQVYTVMFTHIVATKGLCLVDFFEKKRKLLYPLLNNNETLRLSGNNMRNHYTALCLVILYFQKLCRAICGPIFLSAGFHIRLSD